MYIYVRPLGAGSAGWHWLHINLRMSTLWQTKERENSIVILAVFFTLSLFSSLDSTHTESETKNGIQSATYVQFRYQLKQARSRTSSCTRL
jgi:hypothetical protein